MRKILIVVSALTLAASCWLTVMHLVLQHPARQAAVSVLFVLQSAMTLFLLTPGVGRRALAWFQPIVLVGAAGLLYSGWTVMGVQLSRSGFDSSQPRASHFEGYALVIGFALVAQAILTILTFLPLILFPRSIDQSLA